MKKSEAHTICKTLEETFAARRALQEKGFNSFNQMLMNAIRDRRLPTGYLANFWAARDFLEGKRSMDCEAEGVEVLAPNKVKVAGKTIETEMVSGPFKCDYFHRFIE